jgi:hypothetical protein
MAQGDSLYRSDEKFFSHFLADVITDTVSRSEQSVYFCEVAYIKPVYQGQIHPGVFYVKISLQVAGVFHGQDDFVFVKIVLAEDVQAIFVEVAIKS